MCQSTVAEATVVCPSGKSSSAPLTSMALVHKIAFRCKPWRTCAVESALHTVPSLNKHNHSASKRLMLRYAPRVVCRCEESMSPVQPFSNTSLASRPMQLG